jgi:hypothetical protein
VFVATDNISHGQDGQHRSSSRSRLRGCPLVPGMPSSHRVPCITASHRRLEFPAVRNPASVATTAIHGIYRRSQVKRCTVVSCVTRRRPLSDRLMEGTSPLVAGMVRTCRRLCQAVSVVHRSSCCTRDHGLATKITSHRHTVGTDHGLRATDNTDSTDHGPRATDSTDSTDHGLRATDSTDSTDHGLRATDNTDSTDHGPRATDNTDSTDQGLRATASTDSTDHGRTRC